MVFEDRSMMNDGRVFFKDFPLMGKQPKEPLIYYNRTHFLGTNSISLFCIAPPQNLASGARDFTWFFMVTT